MSAEIQEFEPGQHPFATTGESVYNTLFSRERPELGYCYLWLIMKLSSATSSTELEIQFQLSYIICKMFSEGLKNHLWTSPQFSANNLCPSLYARELTRLVLQTPNI